MNIELREELLRMAAEDDRVRAELVREGMIWEGYHPRMEEVHVVNAARLEKIIAEYGWPGRSQVGEDGAEAAWLILQHAIGNPPLQRRGIQLLDQAAAEDEVPRWQVAYLIDRVRFFEGKPQIYGTQGEPNNDGFPRPYTIEDPEHVDERRASVGLDPLEERYRKIRAAAAKEGAHPPQDREAWQRKFEDWLHAVGWRE